MGIGETCKQPTSRSQKTIQCSACTKVLHLNVTCSNVKPEDYEHLESEKKLASWKCPSWIQSRTRSVEGFNLNDCNDENTSDYEQLTPNQLLKKLDNQFKVSLEEKIGKVVNQLRNEFEQKITELREDNEIPKRDNIMLKDQLENLEDSDQDNTFPVSDGNSSSEDWDTTDNGDDSNDDEHIPKAKELSKVTEPITSNQDEESRGTETDDDPVDIPFTGVPKIN
ncbi:hypothetical protein FQR65_LT10292 [Abscondita terminalis]|nr:hypothetical protein FQR65_LT10292 [Abscondita terminalis]